MRKLLKLLMASLMVLSLAACSDTATDENGEVSTTDKVFNVGILQLVEHPALDSATQGFYDAMAERGYIDGETVNYDKQNAQGDMSNCETIANKFVNAGVDLIFANATPAAQAAASKTSDIPIVITAVTDPESAGLVDTNELSNTNVTGTSDLTPVKEQIALLQDLLPNAKKVAIMYSSSEDNSIFQKDIAIAELEAAGLEYVEASVSDTTMIQSVTESLIGKVDAIYIPTDNLLAENMGTVSNITNENGIPVIVGEPGMVALGGLATYGIDYYNLGLSTGQIAADILEGADPSTMGITYLPAENCELVINQTTADLLGIEISAELLATAKIIE
jgi:putative ABC transport system substrate-binding protein